MAPALQGEALRHDPSEPGLHAQEKMDRAEEAFTLECASHASARRRLHAWSCGHGLGLMPAIPASCARAESADEQISGEDVGQLAQLGQDTFFDLAVDFDEGLGVAAALVAT